MPRTVSTIHNYAKLDLEYTYNKFIASIFEPVWNWACAKHTCNVVLSNDMKNYYSRFWRNKNLHVIPNTRVIDTDVNESRIQEIRSFAEGRNVIGSLSVVTVRKGLGHIIQFLTRNENWVYVHVGGGDLAELQSQAQELGVANRCMFLGHKNEGFEYVHAFDVFAMPSLSEGFPLSLIEAVQIGTPIVASKIPVFEESFSSSEISFFALNNNEEFSQAVDRVMKNKGSYIEKALAKFRLKYAPDIVANDYLNVYQEIQ